MNRAPGLLSRGYRCLLRLYPASFRAEFAAEMDEVFLQASADAARRGWGMLARFCVRELGTWPGALGQEWASSLQARFDREKGPIMAGRPLPHELVATGADAEGRSPWVQALLAALALLVAGLALAGLPDLFSPWYRALRLGSYLIILLGLLAGWIRGFPRWSYPYVGYGLVFSLWLSSVSTHGLELLGYAFAPNGVWGGRAWLGLAAVAVLALLWTRSLWPLARLFIGIWREWTCLSLVIYGTLPLLIWSLADEVHDPYRTLPLILSSLFLAAGALAYMRSGTTLRRICSLLAGLTASWPISTGFLYAYWHGPRVPGHAPFVWSKTTLPMVYAWGVVMAALLVPGVLGLLRRVVPRRRAA